MRYLEDALLLAHFQGNFAIFHRIEIEHTDILGVEESDDIEIFVDHRVEGNLSGIFDLFV